MLVLILVFGTTEKVDKHSCTTNVFFIEQGGSIQEQTVAAVVQCQAHNQPAEERTTRPKQSL